MKTRTIVVASVALAVVLAAAVFVYIGRVRVTDDAFSLFLSQADALAESGEREKALSLLKKAGRRSGGVANYLSVAKRQMALSDFDAAEKSLRQAIRRFPANDRLSAALVYLLVRQNRVDETEPFIPFVAGTEFSTLGAYAEIALDAPDFSLGGEKGFKARPQAYEEAWALTGKPSFRRNAAVLYSLAGDYNAAFSMYAETSALSVALSQEEASGQPENERLFRALLAYDAQAFSEVAELIGSAEGGIEAAGQEAALLAADALFLDENEEAAALIWENLSGSDVADNPLVFFNRALTASSWAEKRASLEKCLDLFPEYYPALAAYVRSALSLDSPENYFPFYGDDFSIKALGETSHVSQGMEEAYLNRPVSIIDARNALDAALEAAAEDSPYRLQIELERVRYLCFQTGKDAEARHSLWNILERYSGESLAHEFALWFFAAQGDYDVFFGLVDDFEVANPVYAGIAEAVKGNLDSALERFNAAAAASSDWAAIADIATVLKKRGAYSDAADNFALAADLAATNEAKSRLYYQAALAFEQQKAYLRAADMLRHAVSLDEGNYSARTMLRRLEAERGV